MHSHNVLILTGFLFDFCSPNNYILVIPFAHPSTCFVRI